MSIELNRNGFVAKVLTWGMDNLDKEKYLSTRQNICPMFWRFVFKIVQIVLWYVWMLFAVLFVISILYSIGSYLSTLTLWGGLTVTLKVLGMTTISTALSVLVCYLGYTVLNAIVGFIRSVAYKKREKPMKESKNELVQLAASYTEAKRNRFCSAVTFG